MNMLYLLIIAHDIGDYYLQTSRTSIRKSESYTYTLRHCMYYAIPFLILGMLSPKDGRVYLLAILSHALIDCFKCFGMKNYAFFKNHSVFIYVGDQVFHMITLILLSYGSTAMMGNDPLIGGICYLMTIGQPMYVSLNVFRNAKIYNTFDLRGLHEKADLIVAAIGLWHWFNIWLIMVWFAYQVIKSDRKKEQIAYIGQLVFIVSCIRIMFWIMSGKG